MLFVPAVFCGTIGDAPGSTKCPFHLQGKDAPNDERLNAPWRELGGSITYLFSEALALPSYAAGISIQQRLDADCTVENAIENSES